jgi:hypothetical protein
MGIGGQTESYGENILPSRDVNLRERIDRILHTPEFKLDGEAYRGKYELGDNASIKRYILDNLRKVYKNLDTGDKITITNNSAGKIAGHKGDAYRKTIIHVPTIIENMKFLESTQANRQDAKYGGYSYYITPININGNPYTVLSTVGKNKIGIYYDQNIFEGTIQEVFAKAKNVTDAKYSRLIEILSDTKRSGWNPT